MKVAPRWAIDSGASVASGVTESCEGGGRLFWLPEGNFSFQLSAIDRGKNSVTFDPLVLVVDMQPPIT